MICTLYPPAHPSTHTYTHPSRVCEIGIVTLSKMATWIKQPWIENALKSRANSLPKIARAQVLKVRVRCNKVFDLELRKPGNQRIFQLAKLAKKMARNIKLLPKFSFASLVI